MAGSNDPRLRVDGPRPAVELVAELPSAWTTDQERLVLLVMACDSYDGQTCQPGVDHVATWVGLSRATVYRILRELTTPIPGRRPALLAREKTTKGGPRTVFRILPGTVSEPSQNRLSSVRQGTVSQPSHGADTHPSSLRDPSSSRALRTFVAGQLGAEDDDDRLDHIDTVLASAREPVRNPRAYLATMQRRGDLAPALDEALDQARAQAARRAQLDALRCPHGTVNGTRPGQCPSCDVEREEVAQ